MSFDSLAPARFTVRANLQLLYLKGPAFSIVANCAGFGLKATRVDLPAERDHYLHACAEPAGPGGVESVGWVEFG